MSEQHYPVKSEEREKDHSTVPPVLFEKRENCCGCSACYAICPVHAISMEPDEEGFLYPKIDAGKCVHCKSCLRVCPLRKR